MSYEQDLVIYNEVVGALVTKAMLTFEAIEAPTTGWVTHRVQCPICDSVLEEQLNTTIHRPGLSPTHVIETDLYRHIALCQAVLGREG